MKESQIKKVRLEKEVLVYNCDVFGKDNVIAKTWSSKRNMISGNLVVRNDANLNQCIVGENAYIGNHASIVSINASNAYFGDYLKSFSVICDNNIVIGDDSRIDECISNNGDITCGDNTRIGYALANGYIMIGNSCDINEMIARDSIEIGNNAICTKKIICCGDISIGRHARISDIDVGGNILIGDHSQVDKISAKGNIVIAANFTSCKEKKKITSDQNITIGSMSYIVGDIFAKGDIVIGQKTTTGNISSLGNIIVYDNSKTGKLEAKGQITYLESDE